jgi:hypothetical protein
MPSLPSKVTFPWISIEVDVDGGLEEPTDEECEAIANMAAWTDSLRTKLERACFADYLAKIYAIDAKPPTVPVIKEPEHVWQHVDVRTVCPQGRDFIVVYAVPEWDLDEHHEWCVHGTDELVYVGQVISYSAEGYFDIDETINRARNYDEIIQQFGHLPLQWADD